MIAGISFALLVLVALGYVVMPLVTAGRRPTMSCARCGAARGEEERYCVACGLPVEDWRPAP